MSAPYDSTPVRIQPYVDVGVMTSTVLLALDLRESAGPPIELALVLGTELLWGDCASPVRRGGVAAADVLMGGGSVDLT